MFDRFIGWLTAALTRMLPPPNLPAVYVYKGRQPHHKHLGPPKLAEYFCCICKGTGYEAPEVDEMVIRLPSGVLVGDYCRCPYGALRVALSVAVDMREAPDWFAEGDVQQRWARQQVKLGNVCAVVVVEPDETARIDFFGPPGISEATW